jgi:hypothetical protein
VRLRRLLSVRLIWTPLGVIPDRRRENPLGRSLLQLLREGIDVLGRLGLD